ncbi:hypothetical protein LEP1GSC088_1983 [Leptospira interrogans str. L1207]|nr:hypothetical protein LEP1GSC088_1983 [Leptospira interrogans str. L1207]
MLESIILLVIIFFPLIFFFLMASHLRKKIRIRRKSFITPTNWDYIIIAVFIILGIVSTIGLIGFGIFRGLISESMILGIPLILFFLIMGYLRDKIRRKSFWDYILFGTGTSSSGSSSRSSWGSSGSSSSGGSSWSDGGGSSGGGGASGSW